MSRFRLRPRLAIVWLVLIVLAGLIVYLELGGGGEESAPAPTGRIEIFDFTEPELGAVEVMYRGQFTTLMRAEDGSWFQHDASHSHTSTAGAGETAPEGEQHVADPAAAAELANTMEVMARLKADRKVAPEQDLREYGLRNPQAMIAFYGKGPDGPDFRRPLEVVYVGELLPTNFTYYTLLENDPELTLIPRYYISLLLTLAFGADQAPAAQPESPPLPAQN